MQRTSTVNGVKYGASKLRQFVGFFSLYTLFARCCAKWIHVHVDMAGRAGFKEKRPARAVAPESP
jgi:hypothetical protein